jgi:hypothetical protein
MEELIAYASESVAGGPAENIFGYVREREREKRERERESEKGER